MKQALFLDRDDTLIPNSPYLRDPDQVRLFPDTRDALIRLRAHYRLFLFSNQSGIGRGYYRLEDAQAVNRRMEALLALPGSLFDAVCLPPEPPGIPSAYRKPSPRFILETLQQFDFNPASCWMVGDRLSDLQAGIEAGIRTALVRTIPSADNPELAHYIEQHRIPVFATLLDFAMREE